MLAILSRTAQMCDCGTVTAPFNKVLTCFIPFPRLTFQVGRCKLITGGLLMRLFFIGGFKTDDAI
jgi:hypothetical protein